MSQRVSDRLSSSGIALSAWPLAAGVFLVILVVYVSTFNRIWIHSDAQAATVQSWRIATSGTPWLEDVPGRPMEELSFVDLAANGHVVAQRMAGPVLAGIPFYLGADPLAFSTARGGVAAAVWAALAALLMFLALRRAAGPALAAGATAAFALATPMWSVAGDMLWTHTVTVLGITGAAFAMSRDRYSLAGVFFGVGMLGRPHLAVIAALVGVGLALAQKRWRPMISIAVPTLAALGALAVWNRWMFGFWSIGGAYSGKAEVAIDGFDGNAQLAGPYAQLVNYLGFLVAPDRGLLIWTPVVLVLFPALVRSWRALPRWSTSLLLGGLLYSFIQLRLNYFPGGDTFYGYRHALELIACMTPALALSVPRAGRVARLLLPIVIMLQAAAIALGAISERYLIHIEDVWTDNSLWRASREAPAVTGAFLIGAVLVGAYLSILLKRRHETKTYPQG